LSSKFRYVHQIMLLYCLTYWFNVVRRPPMIKSKQPSRRQQLAQWKEFWDTRRTRLCLKTSGETSGPLSSMPLPESNWAQHLLNWFPG